MPTIQTGLMSALRSAFIMRSVPMLPEPISAALILCPMPPVSTPVPGRGFLRITTV